MCVRCHLWDILGGQLPLQMVKTHNQRKQFYASMLCVCTYVMCVFMSYVCYRCSSVSASVNGYVACTMPGCMAYMCAYGYVPYTCTCVLSHIRLFATPWPVACQVPLSMECSRQEYWSGLPLPTLGDLSHPGVETLLRLLHWQVDSLPLHHLGSSCSVLIIVYIISFSTSPRLPINACY